MVSVVIFCVVFSLLAAIHSQILASAAIYFTYLHRYRRQPSLCKEDEDHCSLFFFFSLSPPSKKKGFHRHQTLHDYIHVRRWVAYFLSIFFFTRLYHDFGGRSREKVHKNVNRIFSLIIIIAGLSLSHTYTTTQLLLALSTVYRWFLVKSSFTNTPIIVNFIGGLFAGVYLKDIHGIFTILFTHAIPLRE